MTCDIIKILRALFCDILNFKITQSYIKFALSIIHPSILAHTHYPSIYPWIWMDICYPWVWISIVVLWWSVLKSFHSKILDVHFIQDLVATSWQKWKYFVLCNLVNFFFNPHWQSWSISNIYVSWSWCAPTVQKFQIKLI